MAAPTSGWWGQPLRARAAGPSVRRGAHGAVGALAARVGPGGALAQALGVLRRRQNLDLLPVREGEDGELLALQKLLDYDLAARVSQPPFGEHGPGGRRRLVPRRTDHGALAAGEPRGLDDERHGVAGRVGGGAEGRGGEVALQRPAERVLAAAPADDQDPHFFFKASAKAWAARFAVSTTSSTTAFASFM